MAKVNLSGSIVGFLFFSCLILAVASLETTTAIGEAHNETLSEVESGGHEPTVPWRGWFVLATLVALVIILFTTRVNITAAITALAILYFLVPIISVPDLFIGFGNGGVVAIELFYIIMYPMASLPLVKRAGYFLMKGAEDRPRMTLLKICLASMLLSMWFDNPPQVAVMTSIIMRYCVSEGISPAMFLLPVNFAATLGNYTLTATLSNLIIYGIIETLHLPNAEYFDLIKVNGPLILFELAYLVLVPPLLWKSRKGSFNSREGEVQFTVQLRINLRSRLIDKPTATVGDMWGEKSKLIEVVGVFRSADVAHTHNRLREDTATLSEGDRIVVKAPPTVIQSGSLYWGYSFTFQHGFQEERIAPTNPFETEEAFENNCTSQLLVVVLSQQTFGLGTSVGEQHFSQHYGLQVVACSSNGSDMKSEDLSQHIFTAADSVLCYGNCKHIAQYVHKHEFVIAYCVNSLHDQTHDKSEEHDALSGHKPRILLMPKWWPWGEPVGRDDRRHMRMMIPAAWRYTSVLIFIAIITLDALRVQPIELLLLIGAAAYILFGIISIHEAFHAIHLERYALAAFSFSLGVAFEKSLFAEVIGESIALRHLTPFLNLLVISLLSTLFSDLATSEAAAQLMVPVVVAIFRENGGNIRAALVVAMASVANTLWTPYGNVNNTIVYATGVYRFRDFLYFGLPLSIMTSILIPISATIVFRESFS